MRTGAKLGKWLFCRGDALTGVAPQFANRPYGLPILDGEHFTPKLGSLRQGILTEMISQFAISLKRPSGSPRIHPRPERFLVSPSSCRWRTCPHLRI